MITGLVYSMRHVYRLGPRSPLTAAILLPTLELLRELWWYAQSLSAAHAPQLAQMFSLMPDVLALFTIDIIHIVIESCLHIFRPAD